MRYIRLWLSVISTLSSCAIPAVTRIRTCRISEFTCRGDNQCIPLNKYCDKFDHCKDKSDEPPFCTVCNRTYYGEIGKTYELSLEKPLESKLPFLCHISFTANGHRFGDIIQLGFEQFHVGWLEPFSSPSPIPPRYSPYCAGCPDGYIQILELGRPFTSGGCWCGESNAPAFYYSESSTVTITLRLFYTGRFQMTNFAFRLKYKFLAEGEAVARMGNATAPYHRGELIPGTYCGRNYYECYRKRCRIQSPNFPGIYPRNLTCSYYIRQKVIPKCKHVMISVHQRDEHRLKMKRWANASTSSLKVWNDCQGSDRLVFYDGLTTTDAILLTFCRGNMLPPVLSRGPKMLVVFHAGSGGATVRGTEVDSFPRGFDLEVDTVFADSDSNDFSRHPSKCEFLIRASLPETEYYGNEVTTAANSGFSAKTAARMGTIASPRHTLAPETTCVYRFQGMPADKIWISVASYWKESLADDTNEGECLTRFRLSEGDVVLADTCGKEGLKICEHARTEEERVRPCDSSESYTTEGSNLTLRYYTERGTAVDPSKFIVRYEFVNTDLGGKGTRSPCRRVFKGVKSGFVSSPSDVFMYARGGAKTLSCLYRIEANAGEKIKLTVKEAAFGKSGGRCKMEVNAHNDRFVCSRSGEENASRLEVSDLPWKDVSISRMCVCGNITPTAFPIHVSSFSRALEITFQVWFSPNFTEDFDDVFFAAEFQITRQPDCGRKQRIRGSGGEIRFEHPPAKRADVQCDKFPWMLQARKEYSLFLLAYGSFLPVVTKAAAAAVTEIGQIRCDTKNRIIVYRDIPPRIFRVICPSKSRDSKKELHIFSEEWFTTGGYVSPSILPSYPEYKGPPTFLLEFVGREAGSYVLNWLEISRPKASFFISDIGSVEGLNGNASVVHHSECPHKCPELNACIDRELWCDGTANCPSAFDELPSHCQLDAVALRYYALACGLAFASAALICVYCFRCCKRRKKTREMAGKGESAASGKEFHDGAYS